MKRFCTAPNEPRLLETSDTAPSTSVCALPKFDVLVTSIEARAVKAPFVPPVIRSSLMDSAIWSLVVTLAPTWNTPPPVVVTEAEDAGTNGRLAPTVVIVIFEPVPVLLRTSSTDHAPPP